VDNKKYCMNNDMQKICVILETIRIQTELDVLVLFGGRQKDLKLFCGKRFLNSALLSILMLALLIMWSKVFV